MNLTIIQPDAIALPVLIDRAAAILSGARGAAEVLEARDMASFAGDVAKKQARLLKAKSAADDLIKAAYRVQADALDIEAQAKRRLADEYDAAQEDGEAARQGRPKKRSEAETFFHPGDGQRAAERLCKELFGEPANLRDIPGLTKQEIHEARIIRDAEEAEPGVVRRTLDDALNAGEEPTKAKVRRAVMKSSKRKKQTRGPRFSAPQETQHDRDLRALLGVWESSCESAREEFLKTVN